MVAANKREMMASTSMVSANSSAHSTDTEETSSTQDDDVSLPSTSIVKKTSDSLSEDNAKHRPQSTSEKVERKVRIQNVTRK